MKKEKSVKTKTYKWDASKYLNTEGRITEYLNLVFEEDGDDPEFIAKAFRTVAKARGMSKLARQIGMSRSGLYSALSGDTKPEFATMLKIMNAFGVKMHVA